MTAMKEQIEKAGESLTAFCQCAGPTCSGCETKTKELFTRGANFVLERAKILEEALEKYDNDDNWFTDEVGNECFKLANGYVNKFGNDLAKSALEKFHGEEK